MLSNCISNTTLIACLALFSIAIRMITLFFPVLAPTLTSGSTSAFITAFSFFARLAPAASPTLARTAFASLFVLALPRTAAAATPAALPILVPIPLSATSAALAPAAAPAAATPTSMSLVSTPGCLLRRGPEKLTFPVLRHSAAVRALAASPTASPATLATKVAVSVAVPAFTAAFSHEGAILHLAKLHRKEPRGVPRCLQDLVETGHVLFECPRP